MLLSFCLSKFKSAIIISTLFVFPLLGALGQVTSSIDQLAVFLECKGCDINYIKQEVNQINYLRDRADANIHVQVLKQSSGSGGQLVTLNFMGKKEFESLKNSISYSIPPQAAAHKARQLFVHHFRLGLVAYWAHTNLGEKISLKIPSRPTTIEGDTTSIPEKDPWNYWVFRITGGGSFNSESSRTSFNLSFNLTANHVTPELRIRSRAYTQLNQQIFKSEEGKINSERERKGFSGSIVKSLNNHWSYGVFSGIYGSTYSNIASSIYASPALEFNLFPYDEVMKREFTFAYKIGPSYRWYMEETIFEKTQENLFRQSLEMALRLNQPWGSVWVGVEGSNYFHDFEKNRLEFNSRLDFRLIKGLALNFRSSLELIQDQLSLPKGDVSLQDVLLSQTQQATDFESYVSLGVSYTFGSVYNNFVNTRL